MFLKDEHNFFSKGYFKYRQNNSWTAVCQGLINWKICIPYRIESHSEKTSFVLGLHFFLYGILWKKFLHIMVVFLPFIKYRACLLIYQIWNVGLKLNTLTPIHTPKSL